MKSRTLLFLMIVVTVGLLGLSGCGNIWDNDFPLLMGRVSFSIYWPRPAVSPRTIPLNTQSLKIVISGAGIATDTFIINRQDYPGDIITIERYVPSGSARIFIVTAHTGIDATGDIVARAQATADIYAGQVNRIAIELVVPGGQIVITIGGDFVPTSDGKIGLTVGGDVLPTENGKADLAIGGDYTPPSYGDLQTGVGGDYTPPSYGDVNVGVGGDVPPQGNGDLAVTIDSRK